MAIYFGEQEFQKQEFQPFFRITQQIVTLFLSYRQTSSVKSTISVPSPHKNRWTKGDDYRFGNPEPRRRASGRDRGAEMLRIRAGLPNIANNPSRAQPPKTIRRERGNADHGHGVRNNCQVSALIYGYKICG